MASVETKDLRARVTALSEPSRRLDDYGNHECGCTWDSGPFGVYCRKHDREAVADDVFAELREAAREVLEHPSPDAADRLRLAVDVADALRSAEVATD